MRGCGWMALASKVPLLLERTLTQPERARHTIPASPAPRFGGFNLYLQAFTTVCAHRAVCDKLAAMASSMTRRGFVGTAAAGLTGQPARANDSRPNILWICTDQQRWDTIRSLGNEHLRTPNIDRLVSSGVAFERAYCQSPICTPSRAGFLTGMYPSAVHGCMNGNDRWDDAVPLVTKDAR